MKKFEKILEIFHGKFGNWVFPHFKQIFPQSRIFRFLFQIENLLNCNWFQKNSAVILNRCLLIYKKNQRRVRFERGQKHGEHGELGKYYTFLLLLLKRVYQIDYSVCNRTITPVLTIQYQNGRKWKGKLLSNKWK